MTTITAETILRSRNTSKPDKVLSTLLLRYPRWIHAEVMTHRQFSRNAASSRAIPVTKLIQDVVDDPAVPLFWGKNQKGMQAGDEIDSRVAVFGWGGGTDRTREQAWLLACQNALKAAEAFSIANYHKQIVNRLLEPFSHITVLVSATEWTNFLALRDHPDAEPHIRLLAQAMRRELERTDNIQDLHPGEWHTPFAEDDGAHDRLSDFMYLGQRNGTLPIPTNQETFNDLQRKLSVACCASTSYKTVEGFEMTIENAIRIHDGLVGSTPLHASPAEHVAQADEWRDGRTWGIFHEGWQNEHKWGNFKGFQQYRKMLPGECQ